MIGQRVPDGEWFERRNDGRLEPGDYGRELITKGSGTVAEREEWDWFVCCPDGSTTALWVNDDDNNGNRHVVIEHEDGSISVGGSILGHTIASKEIGGVGPVCGWGFALMFWSWGAAAALTVFNFVRCFLWPW